MTMNTKIWILAGVVIIALALVAWFSWSPSNPLPVEASDHLTSWALPLPQDAASSSPQVEATIAELKSYVGTTTYSTADIYVGIGNEYLLLGDGHSAYNYYIKAIQASSTEAVAYDNMGALFAELHASSTALKAYKKAVALSPTTEFYQLSYLNYLAQVAPNDPATEAAFDAAAGALGRLAPNYLIARAVWLGSIGSTTAAIDTWEQVRTILPERASAIDAQIAQLEKS